jgi:hypothetical protein
MPRISISIPPRSAEYKLLRRYLLRYGIQLSDSEPLELTQASMQLPAGVKQNDQLGRLAPRDALSAFTFTRRRRNSTHEHHGHEPKAAPPISPKSVATKPKPGRPPNSGRLQTIDVIVASCNKLRKQSGAITQEEVARDLKVSVSTLRNSLKRLGYEWRDVQSMRSRGR